MAEEPSRSFRFANRVVWAMRSMEEMALSTASCSAATCSLELEFRANTTEPRIWLRSELTSLRAASVVPSRFESVCEFWMAWCRERTWARNCSEMTSPDGSSPARLILRPVESRSSDLR